jgi:hypothetical protein
VTRREQLASMKFHWQDAYDLRLTAGQYTATAKFGTHETLAADDPEQLLVMIRRHYRRDPPEERYSI